MIYIESKKKSLKTLQKMYPDARILDLTSKGDEPWVKVSPFYPHGGIPVPYSDNYYSASVEGVWQGLKVFESADIDTSKFDVRDMKGIKRTVRKFGKPLGHRKGVRGGELLDYITARKEIYLRTYGWVLDNKANHTIQLLKEEALKNDLVFLDFDTNGDVNNTKRPLSHAALVKRYLEKKYPELATLSFVSKPEVVILESDKEEGKVKTKAKRSKKTKKSDTDQDLKLF
ncbi:MAG: hypothetical protein JSS76_13270 [Bacteroidetes bacterium]|nr:hypothetical protein [Bacteroidota bacterium]